MIQGAIKFTYDDKQDCGVIGVSFAKRCYHHEAQSTPISAAGRAEANGTESSEMRVAKRRAETGTYHLDLLRAPTTWIC
ncbi:hypothetical protein CYMTET_41472 [Cymbomonas tetramitiformis]|uniref:Uncharacterized protein n=1 Tax=Cymbomonas tetramitiformis TaxID=36881 RepID=A0AAE0C604_9CHLO|nr:hypothetical protein CYMTET_41472 [Cymbomonas tetramitiformis]